MSGSGGGLVGAGGTGVVGPVGDSGIAPMLKGLHVSGNRIVNGSNQPVQLRGVNRSGSEYACIKGMGVFDGPVDDASIAAMSSWKINAVRVPLNETCWLGINGVNAGLFGAGLSERRSPSYVARLVAAPDDSDSRAALERAHHLAGRSPTSHARLGSLDHVLEGSRHRIRRHRHRGLRSIQRAIPRQQQRH